MADEIETPNLDGLVDRLVESLLDPKKLIRVERAMRNAHAEGATIANAAEFAATQSLTSDEGGLKDLVERFMGFVSAWFLSAVVENTFEVDVDNIAFGRLGATAGRHAVAKAITDKMVEGLTGGSKSVEASPQPAANYLSVVFGQVFESWALGEMVEIATAFFPKVDKIEHIADLGDKLVNAMGITDSSARVLRPYIDNLVVEPLRRHIAKTYRPTQLSEALAIRAFLRGSWTADRTRNELAEQGFSEDRIDELLASHFKYLGLDDVLGLIRHGVVGRDYALQNLRDQGYDDATAQYALVAAETKRLDAINDNALTSLVTAYSNGDLTDGQFRSFLPAIIVDDNERDAFEQAARIRREVNVSHMSEAQIVDCIELEILPFAAYREWLERQAYPPEEATALELRLRVRLQKERDVERARRELAEERAAEQQRKVAAAAARQAALEQERALAQRGPLSELRRAAAHGRIPVSRVEEVLRAQYDADTVAIILGNVEEDRQAYVAQQQKAEDAKKRGTLRHVDVGDLEQAVLTGVLTLAQYRDRLTHLAFDDAGADILTATLRVRKADYDAAQATRREATTKAKARSVNLDTVEQLVRRGARSMADYDALLRRLGFDEVARAAMADLLRLQIAEDAKARQAREKTRTEDPAKSVSLEQFRRAVLLGNATLEDFDRYLTTQRYTPESHALLVAELRDDLAQAEAARQARSQVDASPEPRAIPLSTVRRAARLGFIPPADYADRLAAAGYTDDDIELEMELLVAEIADVQAARQQEAATDAATPAIGLTLAQLAAAVRAGVKHLEDYRALAVTKGLNQADAATLVRVLADELAASDAARVRRNELGSELQPRDINLATLEHAVRGGTLSLADYATTLVAAGLDSLDVNLLVSLLNDETLAAGR